MTAGAIVAIIVVAAVVVALLAAASMLNRRHRLQHKFRRPGGPVRPGLPGVLP